MPVVDHSSFPLPTSPSAKLWRYMDFTKLHNLCRTSKLYFASAHHLREKDPFEGSYTLYHSTYQLVGTVGGEQDERWITERHTPPPDWDDRTWRWSQDVDLNIRMNLNKYMFINSWHMNDNESLAMWKLYDPAGYGVAVVSSFDRLRESLAANEEPIRIGCVTYIDYNADEKWLGNYYDPFIHKHKAFAHEREVRAIAWDSRWNACLERLHREMATKYYFQTEPVNFGNDRQNVAREELTESALSPPAGIGFDCDLDRLIDCIVVSPTAQQWVVEEIREYCNDMVGKQVLLSELKSGPFF